jgi:hypothetical protein
MRIFTENCRPHSNLIRSDKTHEIFTKILSILRSISHRLRDKYKKYGTAREVESTVDDLSVIWYVENRWKNPKSPQYQVTRVFPTIFSTFVSLLPDIRTSFARDDCCVLPSKSETNFDINTQKQAPTLKMEAESPSETLASLCKTASCHILQEHSRDINVLMSASVQCTDLYFLIWRRRRCTVGREHI